MKKIYAKFAFVSVAILLAIPALAAKPLACTGVSKKCTKDVRFDKTIEGQTYSCYECKQTLCKSNGNGPIAGTEITSVCESKGSSAKTRVNSKRDTLFNAPNSKLDKRVKTKTPVAITSKAIDAPPTIDEKSNRDKR